MEENDQQQPVNLDDVPLEQLLATKQQFVQERAQKAAQIVAENKFPTQDELDGMSLDDLQTVKMAHQIRNEQMLAPHRQQIQTEASSGQLPWAAGEGVGPFLARTAVSPLRSLGINTNYAISKGRLSRGEASDTDLRNIALYEREKGIDQQQPEWAQVAAIPVSIAGNVAPTALSGGANIALDAFTSAAAHQGKGLLNPDAVTEAAPSFLVQMGVLKAMGPLASKLFPESVTKNLAGRMGTEALTGTAGLAVADYATYLTGLTEHGGPIKDALDGKFGAAAKSTVANLLFTGAMAVAHGGSPPPEGVYADMAKAMKEARAKGLSEDAIAKAGLDALEAARKAAAPAAEPADLVSPNLATEQPGPDAGLPLKQTGPVGEFLANRDARQSAADRAAPPVPVGPEGQAQPQRPQTFQEAQAARRAERVPEPPPPEPSPEESAQLLQGILAGREKGEIAPGSSVARPAPEAGKAPSEAVGRAPEQPPQDEPAEKVPPERVATMRAALKSLGINSGKWPAEQVMAEARRFGIDKATERAPGGGQNRGGHNSEGIMPPPAADRRQDSAQRKRVADMTLGEARRELTTARLEDEKGNVTELPIPNARGFQDAEAGGPSPAKGFSDSDGLKALNDTFGYSAGNAMLHAKAEVLKDVGLDAYHQKGDEFLYRGGSEAEIRAKLEQARELLRERVFTYTSPHGEVRRFKGADFSYGTGPDLESAAKGMKAHKIEREAAGERGQRAQLGRISEVGAEEGGPGQRGTPGPDQGASGQDQGAGAAVAVRAGEPAPPAGAGVPAVPATAAAGPEAGAVAGGTNVPPEKLAPGERLRRSRVEARLPDVFEDADREGIPRGDVHRSALDKLRFAQKQAEDVNRVHDEMLNDWPLLRQQQRGIKAERKGQGEDAATVEGLDEVADWLESARPDFIRKGETPEDAVLRIVREGRQAPSEEDAYRHALDYHRELKAAAEEESADVRNQVQRVGERFTEADRRALERELRGEEGEDEEGLHVQAGADAGADGGGFDFGFNAPEPKLTAAQQRAVDLKAAGKSLRESAEVMGVSQETVRARLREAAEAQGKTGSYEEAVVKPRAAEAFERARERAKSQDLMGMAEEGGRFIRQPMSADEARTARAGTAYVRAYDAAKRAGLTDAAAKEAADAAAKRATETSPRVAARVKKLIEAGFSPEAARDRAEREFALRQSKAMGAAALGELTGDDADLGDARLTSINHAQSELDRKALGLAAEAKKQGYPDDKVFEAARAAVQADPELPRKLITELEQKNRPTDPVETAVLLREKVNLDNQIDLTRQYLNDPKYEDIHAEKKAELDDLKAQAKRLLDVTDPAGSAAGAAFRLRRALMDEDFTLSGLEKRAEDAKGKPLTEDEKAEIADLHDKLRKAERELEELRKQGDKPIAPGRPEPGSVPVKQEKDRIQRRIDRFEDQNKPWWAKALDKTLEVQRAGLLSSPSTLLKLGSAAVERVALAPVRQVVAAAWSKVPFVSQVAARSPRWGGGLNVRAEVDAVTTGLMTGLRSMYQRSPLGEGRSEADIAYGDKAGRKEGGNVPSRGVNRVLAASGEVHGAIKAIPFENEFARDARRYSDFLRKQGRNVDSPAAQREIGEHAYRAAEEATFQRGAGDYLADKFNRLVADLKGRDKEGNYRFLPYVAGTGLKASLPILRVPLNIVGEGLRGVFGTITGGAGVGQAVAKGVEHLPQEQADLIMKRLADGTIGATFLALGAIGYAQMGGLYVPGDRRKKDIPEGQAEVFGVRLPKELLHDPRLQLMQAGATFAQQAHRNVNGQEQGTLAGAGAALGATLREVPFVREMEHFNQALAPSTQGHVLAEMTKSLALPQLVQWLARELDKPHPFSPSEQPRSRPAHGFKETVEVGVPGLRQKVAEKK